MKIKKEYLHILFILAVGFLIRSYKGNNSFALTGEFGDNLIDVKNSISNHTLPLFGPPTSHPWLSFGPLYYWLLIPLLLIFNFNPLVGYWLGIFMGTILILLNYVVIKRVVNNKTAYLSSLLMCLSPLWISFSKDARFYFFVTLVFYFLIYSLFIFSKSKKNIFWIGFFTSLMFHFHYSPILLIPSILLFILLTKKINFKDIRNFFIGITVPLIPLLIGDYKNNFSMFKNIVLWIPYRIAGFLGIYPKNNISSERSIQFFKSTVEFIGKSFIFDSNLFMLFFFIFTSIFIFYLVNYIKKSNKNPIITFLIYSLIISVIGVFIHGDVPVHYYLPVFPIPLIIVSLFISEYFLYIKNFFKGIIIGFFFLYVILNTKYYIEFYSKFDDTHVNIDPHFVSYSLQLKVCQYIIKDANGRNYSLQRRGPYDYFEENYSQNYKYLLWYLNNEPKDNQKLVYEILEGKELLKINNKFNINYLNDNIGVIKYEK